MALDVNGRTIPMTNTGFLENIEDWSETVGEKLAELDSVELTQRHWDLIKYLRYEYINNAGNQPNTRNIVKAMAKLWDDKSTNAKSLYDLFPGDPSKQAGKIGGLPESRRKGGY